MPSISMAEYFQEVEKHLREELEELSVDVPLMMVLKHNLDNFHDEVYLASVNGFPEHMRCKLDNHVDMMVGITESLKERPHFLAVERILSHVANQMYGKHDVAIRALRLKFKSEKHISPRIFPYLGESVCGAVLVDGNPQVFSDDECHGLLAHEAAHLLPSLFEEKLRGRTGQRAAEILCDLGGVISLGPGFSVSMGHYLATYGNKDVLAATGLKHPSWKVRVAALEHFSEYIEDERLRAWAVNCLPLHIKASPPEAMDDAAVVRADEHLHFDKSFIEKELSRIALPEEEVERLLAGEDISPPLNGPMNYAHNCRPRS